MYLRTRIQERSSWGEKKSEDKEKLEDSAGQHGHKRKQNKGGGAARPGQGAKAPKKTGGGTAAWCPRE